jgi:GNAT superfamily N-acetyltransferase
VAIEEAARLVAEQVEEMAARYGDAGPSPLDGSDFLPPFGVFLIAELDGVEVGCAGLRLIAEGIGEVKRMYAVPSVRGQGVGRALLRGLLSHARSVGLREVWLETGTRQPEAMGLYVQEGFTAIEPYGFHKDHPESRCFAISL